MNDESQAIKSARLWKNITSLTSVIAMAALIWGFIQWQRANQLTLDLKTAHSTIIEANAKLSVATTQAQQLAKRDLPISVSFRRSLLGNGLVAIFKNNSDQLLEVAAVFSSESTGLEKQQSLVIARNGAIEVGGNQGWPFASGQHIKLSNENFRPSDYVVPSM